MLADVPTVRPDEPISSLAERFRSDRAPSFPVVDEKGDLVGIVSGKDVENALVFDMDQDRPASEIMTRAPITCPPEQTIRSALQLLTGMEISRIPVVESGRPNKPIGILRRKEIFWAYGVMASDYQKLMEATQRGIIGTFMDLVQAEVEIKPDHSRICPRRIRDIDLPESCLIGMVRRAGEIVIPKGGTVIESGDVLILLTPRANETRLWDCYFSPSLSFSSRRLGVT